MALAVAVCFSLLSSCTSDDVSPNTNPDECSQEVSFSADIEPIFVQNCTIAGCHNGDLGEGRDWTDFEKVQLNAANIKSKVLSGEMPKEGSGLSLTADELQAISCWVDQGAKDN